MSELGFLVVTVRFAVRLAPLVFRIVDTDKAGLKGVINGLKKEQHDRKNDASRIRLEPGIRSVVKNG